MTAIDLVFLLDAYRRGTAEQRQRIRAQYPRLKLEFDAIDREDDRQSRIAAHAAKGASHGAG